MTPTVQVGGSVSLSDLLKACSAAENSQDHCKVATLAAVKAQLRLFAASQVRNVATIAGNIVTGSPISDLNPIWVATGTTFTLQSLVGGQRRVPAASFFRGYRCVDFCPTCGILTRIRVCCRINLSAPEATISLLPT
jgi:xanthine dehydrogenase/oxidase